MSQSSSPQAWFYPHPVRDALSRSDGKGDIKQLPLRAALRKRCYRSMGHTLVTPPNSFSTLSKRRSLCIYLQWELVLHNGIEFHLCSDLQARRRIWGEGKFDYTPCGLPACLTFCSSTGHWIAERFHIHPLCLPKYIIYMIYAPLDKAKYYECVLEKRHSCGFLLFN